MGSKTINRKHRGCPTCGCRMQHRGAGRVWQQVGCRWRLLWCDAAVTVVAMCAKGPKPTASDVAFRCFRSFTHALPLIVFNTETVTIM